MGEEKILSNIGFLLGILGTFIAAFPFLSMNSPQIYNIILPIFMGIIGLVLVFKVKKVLNDDVVKVGLFVNPLAILLGIIQLIIFWIK